MSIIIVRADAAHLPLPDASADLICTSPPYYGLRQYADGGEPLAGQIGAEETPREYIAALLACTREWMRVLKPGGSIFVNLGDVYSKRADGSAGRTWREDRAAAAAPVRNTTAQAPRKSLLMLPERYRIACADELGLTVREVIEWHKVNGLPESVRDRCRRAHEDIVHLVRQPRYYSAVDEIREPHLYPKDIRGNSRRRVVPDIRDGRAGADHRSHGDPNPLGRLPGSVWPVPSQPLTVPGHLGVDHFAAWPMEIPRRIILGWSPPGICTICGQGRFPVAARTSGSRRCEHRPGGGAAARLLGYACACAPYTDHPGTGERHRNGDHPGGGNAGVNVNAGTRLGNLGSGKRVGPWRDYHLDRWTPPPARPAVVVDPFGGTGTTALVASILGRTGISIELSADYCRLAQWRTSDSGERARAVGVPKPPPVPDGQGSLFHEKEATP